MKSTAANPTDDDGSPFELDTLKNIASDPRMLDPRFRLTVQRLTDAVQLVPMKQKRYWVLIPVVYVCIFGVSGVIQGVLGTSFFVGMLIPGAAAGALLFLIFRWRDQHALSSWHQCVKLLLADALCPSCAYSLSGQEQRDDRLVRCPECGHHWLHERILRKPDYSPGPAGERVPMRAYKPGEMGTSVRKDDWGKRVPVAGGVLYLAAKVETHPDRKMRLDAALREMRHSGRKKRWFLVVFSLSFVTLFFGGQLALGQLSPSPGRALPIAMLFLFLIGSSVWGIWRLSRSSVGSNDKNAALNRRICPACADMLDEIEPEPDGCTRCRTCGAAWRL